jgi:hypothetical protein
MVAFAKCKKRDIETKSLFLRNTKPQLIVNQFEEYTN